MHKGLDADRLDIFNKDELLELCKKHGVDLSASTRKSGVVQALLEVPLKLSDLTVPQLKCICSAEGLTANGRRLKADILEALQGNGAAKGNAKRNYQTASEVQEEKRDFNEAQASSERGLTAGRLDILSKDELLKLCLKFDAQLSANTAKAGIVQRLLQNPLELSDLTVAQLKDMCSAEGLKKGGNKADIIRTLQSNSTATGNTVTNNAVSAEHGRRYVASFQEVESEPEEEEEEGPCMMQRGLNADRLSILTKEELLELCVLFDVKLPATTGKRGIVQRLLQTPLELSDLTVAQLKDMCLAEDLKRGGNKADIINILRSNRTTTGAADYKAASAEHERIRLASLREVESEIQQQGSLMSRNKYRDLLRKHGLLQDDQDVFHIIAQERGGADHTDNYHFAQNCAMNRSLGSRHDYINAYLAGRNKAEAAVAVSKKYGNKDGRKYNGPSAAELYKKGEDAFRDIRQQNRDWANNAYTRI